MNDSLTDSLAVAVDERRQEITLWDRRRNQRLLIVPDFALFCPVVDGRLVRPNLVEAVTRTDEVSFLFDAAPLADFRVQLKSVEDRLEISSQFLATTDCELNRLELFPEGTVLNLYNVVNFRNRHHTPHTWPELNVGGHGFETDTYSGDWQFAPHPTMFILRKADVHLFFGALDLPKSFGMFLKVEDSRVKHWYLDYGSNGFGQQLKAGDTFVSPRFALFLEQDNTVYQTIDRYTDLLIQARLIPNPKVKERKPWHSLPRYNTWVDQICRADAHLAAELDQQAAGAAAVVSTMDERLVRDALSVIGRERLAFASFCLDDGWQVTRGQWEPHPQRFPNLRQLVDDIHARGMKVLIWWNWAELYEDAEANPAHLIGGGKRNKHGMRMRDYSHPQTQQEYLEPLFHKLFSPDPGCYDLDGVKTDFLADKVHADMPVYDPTWRGEENYFYHVFKLFYDRMRQFKPDACHIGCAGHPFLAEFIDINRTYDVASSNILEHVNRARMLQHTTPGCPVEFDFHSCLENLDAYFQAARENRCSVEIGNILGTRQDLLAPWQPADTAYYQLLRQELARFPMR